MVKKKKRPLRYEPVPLDKLVISDSNVRRRAITADVDDLARNIDMHDLQQPIVVWEKGGKFELLIGQRRYLAAKQLGWKDIPARILDEPLDEMEAKIASFSENALRRDLEPRDKAEVCQYLYDRLGSSVRAVAEHVGVSEPTVRKWLGYAAVPESLKTLVDEGGISRGQAQRLWAGVPEEAKAVEVGKHITETKPAPKDQTRIITAAEELPSRSMESILERAEEMKHLVDIHFILPEQWSRAMDMASKRLDREADDIARDATIEWLDKAGFFAGL